jgi:ABC-type branched-subunit amino acid transport system substrate-binding protein
MRLINLAASSALLLTACTASFAADKTYSPGASDNEIKIGNIMPYSGPASALAVMGRVEEAYLKKINDDGGINGRKLNFVSYDDGFSPSKAMEQARKLIESDEVLLIFSPVGTPSNAAIQRYLNGKGIPHLFIVSGVTKWADPTNNPWSIGWFPSYVGEGELYAKFILKNYPNAKIAVFSSSTDAGKDLVGGFKRGLGDKVAMIVGEKTAESTDPTVDSSIVSLKASGADLFISFAGFRTAVQALKKIAELGWKPVYFQDGAAQHFSAVLDYADGVFSSGFVKEPSDPAWTGDAGVKEYLGFMEKYAPATDKMSSGAVWGYAMAQTLVQVLKQCGDDLTRENVMKQTLALKDFKSNMFLPGVALNTSPTNYYPILQEQFMRYDVVKKSWKPIGDIISVSPLAD